MSKIGHLKHLLEKNLR